MSNRYVETVLPPDPITIQHFRVVLPITVRDDNASPVEDGPYCTMDYDTIMSDLTTMLIGAIPLIHMRLASTVHLAPCDNLRENTFTVLVVDGVDLNLRGLNRYHV